MNAQHEEVVARGRGTRKEDTVAEREPDDDEQHRGDRRDEDGAGRGEDEVEARRGRTRSSTLGWAKSDKAGSFASHGFGPRAVGVAEREPGDDEQYGDAADEGDAGHGEAELEARGEEEEHGPAAEREPDDGEQYRGDRREKDDDAGYGEDEVESRKNAK